jgi:hypothetical protein
MNQKSYVKFGGWLWVFIASVFLVLLAYLGVYIYNTDKLSKNSQLINSNYIIYSLEVFLICFLLGRILFLLMERKKDTPIHITYSLYLIAALGGFGILRWALNFWEEAFKFDYKIIPLFLFVIIWAEYLKWSERVKVYFNYEEPEKVAEIEDELEQNIE